MCHILAQKYRHTSEMKRQLPQIPGQTTLFKAFKSAPRIPDTDRSNSENKCTTGESESVSNDSLTSDRSNAVGTCTANSSTADKVVNVDSGISSSWSENTNSNKSMYKNLKGSLGARFLDIGNLDAEKRIRMSDSQRFSVLTTRFEPSKGWTAPFRACGKKMRRVPDFVFSSEQFPYLRYSPTLDGVFCASCYVFSTAENVLVSRPLTDWSNAKKVVDGHKCSADHLTSMTKADHLVRICNKEEQSILEFGSTAYKNKVQKNRQALSAIIEAIILCGRQNIALRGKTEERSNFKALINFRAKTDDDLQAHIVKAPKHATYMSPEIQNEFISLCGQQISNSIVQRCNNAKYFTILADESADVSDVEQFAFCLRYVDREHSGLHMIREEFLSFVSTDSTTGEALHALLLGEIRKYNLNPSFVVGQGYDGAGNMSGRIRGVQARFAAEHPNAKYVHCRNHRLNLAICHACRVAFVQSMLTVVGDTLFFLTSSPKRLGIYRQHSDNGEKLRKLCPTRWSQHSESVAAFHKNFGPILETLIDLQVGMATKTMSTASSLQRAMLSFDFVIALCVVSKPLNLLNPLSDSMQDPTCDLVKASKHALVLEGMLRQKRVSHEYYNEIWQKAEDLAGQHGIQVTRPRVAARQTNRNNIQADTVKEYWRLNLFIPFMDHLLTELNDRLCISSPRLKAQYLLSHLIGHLTPALWEEIKTEYRPFIEEDAVDMELDTWKYKIAQGGVYESLVDALDATYQLLPNLYAVLKVLLTMPVSTASAERSFSGLRRLKTYLKSTMSEQRLTGLALMHIHRSQNIDTDQVLNAFDASGHRRIALVFDNARQEDITSDGSDDA